jgi:hypothetical protein
VSNTDPELVTVCVTNDFGPCATASLSRPNDQAFFTIPTSLAYWAIMQGPPPASSEAKTEPLPSSGIVAGYDVTIEAVGQTGETVYNTVTIGSNSPLWGWSFQ